jgi:hypothetical protein
MDIELDLSSYIHEFPNSIPDMLCDDIIHMYELTNKNEKFPGTTIGGINKEIKDTTDFIIPKNNELWNNIETTLVEELKSCLTKYNSTICENITNTIIEENFVKNKINIFFNDTFTIKDLMIQKYEKGKGKYIYHNDFYVDFQTKSHRVITFLWYLNTVEEGGHTDFFGGKIKIKPEKGKLVLFPASWCYPHCGRTPISNDKYIITNWVYNHF